LLSDEDIITFKETLKSFKNMKKLYLNIDFNVSDAISEMRSLKLIKFGYNRVHSFTDLIEMCDDRELGFEIYPGYITRLSLA
jgi:hypothetical protein